MFTENRHLTHNKGAHFQRPLKMRSLVMRSYTITTLRDGINFDWHVLSHERTLDGTEAMEDIELLRQATAHVYYRHTEADKVSKNNVNGYDRLKEYVNSTTKKTSQYKGVPFYYSVMNTAGADIEADRILQANYKL